MSLAVMVNLCNSGEHVLPLDGHFSDTSTPMLRQFRLCLTLDLSSSRIQMAALHHTSTPFGFVIRQLLGFFPGQVHLSEVPFDDIYPVLPWSSWLSLVTSQFPVVHLLLGCAVFNNLNRPYRLIRSLWH